MLSTLQFVTVSHLKPVIYIASYIMALRIENTKHATTDMAMCISITIEMYNTIQTGLV